MRSRLIGGLALAAILSVGIVAVGCGGGDDALTKSEFLKQGNAICKKGNQAVDSAANKAFTGNKQPSDAEVTKFAEDTAIPEIQTEIDGIRDLAPPSGDDGKVSAILDEAQAALDKAKADPLIFASNTDPFAKANQLAKDYGLTECAG